MKNYVYNRNGDMITEVNEKDLNNLVGRYDFPIVISDKELTKEQASELCMKQQTFAYYKEKYRLQ